VQFYLTTNTHAGGPGLHRRHPLLTHAFLFLFIHVSLSHELAAFRGHPSCTDVAKASMLCLSDLLHQTHAQVFAPTLTPRRSALGMLLGTAESILSSVAHINYRGLDGAREIKKKRYPSGRSPAIASLLMLSRSLVAAHSHLASPAFVP